jgi:AF1548-like, C-terminal/Restriction endonuclease
MSIPIVKASGQSEDFDIRKLVDSLIRSGASEDIALNIAQKVAAQITPRLRTKHIFRMARKLLRHYNRAADMRYSIKRGIYALGPAGYQFEQYFARILREYGYSVEVNKILHGYCVTHEVDVFATKADEGFVIECKYHSNGGIPTDVKTALYIHSRFTDIKRAYESVPENPVLIRQGWLVTNTRCSSDAIKFAECMGLKIVSWRYPEKESLEKMIENKSLYPVTILTSVKRNILDMLFRNNFILAKDIADIDRQTFVAKSGLDTEIAGMLKREADELCFFRQP